MSCVHQRHAPQFHRVVDGVSISMIIVSNKTKRRIRRSHVLILYFVMMLVTSRLVYIYLTNDSYSSSER